MYQMWMIRWSGRTHASNSMIGAPTIAVTDTWPEPKAKNPLAASSACSCSFGGKFSEIYLRGLQLESHVVNKPRHPSLKDPSPKSTHRPNTNTTLTFSHLCTSHHRTSRPFTLCAKLRAASTDSRLSFCRVFPKAQLRTSSRHPLRIANKDLLKEIATPLRLHSNSLTGFPISQSLIDQSAPHFIATSSWFSVTRDVLPTTLGIRRENNRVIANAYSFACDLSKEEKLD